MNKSNTPTASSPALAHEYGKYDFVGKAPLFGGISALLVLISIIYLMVHGVNYGIDFAGGTEMQIKFAKPVTTDQMRAFSDHEGLTNVHLQGIGDASEFVLRFQTPHGKTDKETNDIQNSTVAHVSAGLTKEMGEYQPEIRRADSVGPQVGADLKRSGILAVFYCLLVILIYVGLRFDYKYAPGAVLCLAHDAIITLAIFVAVGKEVNIPILAAILTLIGFSLNDTIVVFDRIRETDHEVHERGMVYVVNKAINDMWGRTLITSGTTFCSAMCLYLLAGGTVADIAFAMWIGILFGTYSSIYVAAPFTLIIDKMKSAPVPVAVKR